MPVASHPSVADLSAFARGDLGEGPATEIETHLDGCADCATVAAGVSADGFADLLRTADTFPEMADNTPPTASEATLGWEPGGGSAKVPPDLAGHPRYRLLKHLGAGGMGSVWLAEHAVMGRRVALKVIHPALVSRPGAVERFRREVRAAAALHHPNIVTAHDADSVGGTHFLVMEYVEGQSLGELLKGGPIPAADARRYAADAARGLAHAHAHGLTHRDVKPHNLMLAADGTVKLLDFGLATFETNAVDLTGGNMVFGTPDYIAPEQAADARAAGPRSDIYSLGATLFQMLAGRVPFPVEGVLAKVDAHRTETPVLPSTVPADVAAVVAKMMAKNPADRYETSAEAAAALDRCGDPATIPLPTSPPRHRARGGPWVAAGLVAAMLVAAAGVVYRIQTDKGEVVVTPVSDDVEIVLLKGGREVKVIDTKTKKSVTLPVGEYDVAAKNLPDGLQLKTDKVSVMRGQEVLVTLERVPKVDPPPPPPPDPNAEAVKSGEIAPLRVLAGHEKRSRRAVFGETADQVFSCGDEGYVRRWDVRSGKETARYDHGNRVLDLSFVAKQGLLISITSPVEPTDPPSRIWTWDVKTGKEAQPFPGVPTSFAEQISSLRCDPSGTYAATLALNGDLRVFDIAARKQIRLWKTGLVVYSYDLTWSGDGNLLAACGDSGAAVFKMGADEPVFRSPVVRGMTSTAFSPDAKRLYMVGWAETKVMRVYDLASRTQINQIDVRGSADVGGGLIHALPDGRLVVGGYNVAPSIWNATSGKRLLVLKGPSTIRYDVTRDGTRMVAGSEDGSVRVWQLPPADAQ